MTGLLRRCVTSLQACTSCWSCWLRRRRLALRALVPCGASHLQQHHVTRHVLVAMTTNFPPTEPVRTLRLSVAIDSRGPVPFPFRLFCGINLDIWALCTRAENISAMCRKAEWYDNTLAYDRVKNCRTFLLNV